MMNYYDMLAIIESKGYALAHWDSIHRVAYERHPDGGFKDYYIVDPEDAHDLPPEVRTAVQAEIDELVKWYGADRAARLWRIVPEA